ncbi:MAG: hypothetical protein IJ871_02760 [Ruminococcus sp.]|nr:hypothetical protein [Ruminococcus sp.]MBR2304043.1 hypothetical protein [Ruminococcus sp.]
MKKQYLKAILAITLAAACLTACGDSSSKSDSKKSSETTTTAKAVNTMPQQQGAPDEPNQDIDDGADISESATDEPSSAEESKEANSAEEEKEKGLHLSKIETFDSQNNLIYLQEYTYTPDAEGGNIECTITRTGNRIEGQSVTESSSKDVVKYLYSKDFNMLAFYSGVPQILRDEYIYDEKGRLAKIINYDTNGDIEKTTVNEFGSDDKLTKSTEYDKNNEVYKEYDYENGKEIKVNWYATGYVTENEYDNNDNLIKSNIYGKDGSLEETMTYEYDDKNNPTYYKDYYTQADMVRMESKYENSYTSDGYTVKTYSIIDGNTELSSETEFDNDNHCLQELVYLNGNIVETTKYTYIEIP